MEAIEREWKLCENTDVIFLRQRFKASIVLCDDRAGDWCWSAGDINMVRAGVTADTGHTTAIDEPREGHLITFDINISNTDII